MEILKYLFSFCPPNSIIYSFCFFNFSASVGHFVTWQRSNVMSCFLISLTHQVSFTGQNYISKEEEVKNKN